jgi:hypothetical protein
METQFLVVLIILVLPVIAILEVLAAALPLLIIVLYVPAEDRLALATLLAAADSSPRIRLWPALRLAVIARRHSRSTSAPQR